MRFQKKKKQVLTFNLFGITLIEINLFRYGYHLSINSYYLCYDPPTIKKLFNRLRNYDGENKVMTFSN